MLCYKTTKVIDDVKTGAANAKLRRKAKVTQTALAEAMGINAPFLSNLETGIRPWSDEWSSRYEAALTSLTK
jgi:transcriptional regulator with XRE-family HTH domain